MARYLGTHDPITLTHNINQKKQAQCGSLATQPMVTAGSLSCMDTCPGLKWSVTNHHPCLGVPCHELSAYLGLLVPILGIACLPTKGSLPDEPTVAILQIPVPTTGLFSTKGYF